MNPTTTAPPQPPSLDVPDAMPPHFGEPSDASATLQGKAWFRRLHPELLVLLLGTLILNLWSLGRNGFSNEYYSAAVRSMSTSWHNFLYNSFDASGVMTVDKPPLNTWIQALSARVFGFNSWSLLVPEALMGVASVAIVYDITRRHFGRWGALASGIALALTPMTVAMSRHNNPDSLLVLCCVAALWCIVRAFEKGQTKWVVWSGVAVGLGFEAKMGAALLVVPALAAAYMWVAPRGYLTSFKQLLIGGGAMAVVGLAWPVLAWVTPAADRPWISGTSDNSIWSLIMNYNGVGRLDGQSGGPGGGIGGGGGGGGGVFGGTAGATRLFNSALGGQVAWLLGFAVVAGIAIMVASRMRRSDARSGWIIAVGGSFLACAVAFSFAKGIFHPYYTAQLAPFTALLIGAGFGLFFANRSASEAESESDKNVANILKFLAPAALIAGVITELVVMHSATVGKMTWLQIPLIVLTIGAAIALVVSGSSTVRRIALTGAVALLMLAPASWAVQTVGHNVSGTFPAGGPAGAISMGGFGGGGRGGARGGFGGPAFRAGAGSATGTGVRAGAATGAGAGIPTGGPPAGGFGGGAPPAGAPTGMRFGARGAGGGMPGGGMGTDSQTTAALKYISTHGGGSLAVSGQQSAASSIVSSGADIVGIGGFSGRESQVTLSWLAARVKSGDIRWVLTGGSSIGGPTDSRVGSKDAMAAVAKSCKKINLSTSAATTAAATTTNTQSTNTTNTTSTLYDCSGSASALAAAA